MNKLLSVSSNAGRPRKYKTAKSFALKCDAYFNYIKGEFKEKKVKVFDKKLNVERTIKVKEYSRQPEPPTVTGLALFLGFACKSSLYDYKKHDQFSYPCKRALTLIEKKHEEGLHGSNCNGHIFALKNSGWKDKTETELTHSIGEKLIDLSKYSTKDLEDALKK